MSTFVERYIDGSIEVAGDLHDFLRGGRVGEYRFTWDQAKFLSPLSCRRVLIHSKAATEVRRRPLTIANDFFEAFLGLRWSTPSAVFDRVDEPLEAAQERKIRRVGDRLQLSRGDRLLDIGCGWGTLALTLAATAASTPRSDAQLQAGPVRDRAHPGAQAGPIGPRILTLD